MAEKEEGHERSLREQLEVAHRRVAVLEAQLAKAHPTTESQAASLLADDVIASIFETSPTIKGISRLSDGCFVHVNRASLHALGYERDEMVGHTSIELGLWDDPEQRKVITAAVSRDGLIRDFEMGMRTKSGELRQGLMSVAKVMIAGEPHLVLSVVDITHQKQVEHELRRASALFEAIVEQSRDGIALAKPDGRYLLVNPALCAMTGYPQEQLLSMTIRDLLPTGTEPELFPTVAKLHRTGVRETKLVRRDGTQFDVEILGSPIQVDDETLVLGVVRDISARRAAEQHEQAITERMQQSQKLESLGVLAGGIAHDFNNLLVGIMGNAELALMDLPAESPARTMLADIVGTAKRAADLSRQMLAYSGKGRFVVERLELTRLVEEMTHLLEVSISKRAVLRYDFADDTPAIEADASQVRQLVVNLVTNASEAVGDKSGVITVRTGRMDCDQRYLRETFVDDELPAGLYAFIEVADTGSGMDAETVGRVFDPFFSTKFTGRGLGLAATMGIVRGHRGAIKVYSEPGRGTTFKALLPAAKGELSVAAERLPPELPKTGGTILLVDDEETVRAVASKMLRRMGFEVVTAADGRSALSVFGQAPDRFTCVLLDLTMPHMDGGECFREMRRIAPEVKVILVSGYNEQELTSRFAGKGLSDFLQKPYSYRVLAKRLKRVIG